MKLGRNQLISIVGGLVILAGGFGACMLMDTEHMQAFLDFAGGFGWKVIASTVATSGAVKVADAIRAAKSGGQ